MAYGTRILYFLSDDLIKGQYIVVVVVVVVVVAMTETCVEKSICVNISCV